MNRQYTNTHILKHSDNNNILFTFIQPNVLHHTHSVNEEEYEK